MEAGRVGVGCQGSARLMVSYLLVTGNGKLFLFRRIRRSRREHARSQVRKRKQKTTMIMQNKNKKS